MAKPLRIMKDLSYRSPKTQVRESPIHGKGLFAKQAIAAGEIVAVKGGYILTKQEWTTLERQLGSAEVQISEELFIAPTGEEQVEGCMVYSNHSCDPNIAIQGQIVFVAMRDIAPGEELTHDWATTDDLDYVMECNCGSPNCRHIVTGKDWMKKELQEKYKGWFCWFIQRQIDALSSNNSLNQNGFSSGPRNPVG
ncbi:MAG: SET domain-containing protein-lysine N-methyltransferase [Desulfobacteraceae bacterium]|nr:SET domain-containing protein-lysine N-methyltransferase [Desulfobacteraceae bacterium]